MCIVCLGLFVLSIGVIGRLCSVIMALPGIFFTTLVLNQIYHVLILVLLDLICPAFANSKDPFQLASERAN